MLRSLTLLSIAGLLTTGLLACSNESASSPLEPAAATPTRNDAAVAQAASVRIRCEVRTGSRSKISIDGRGLAAGNFTARARSGANTATAAAKASVAGQAEFDFDSNPADIRAGATAISRTFIRNGSVAGDVLNAAGAVVATGTAACQVR